MKRAVLLGSIAALSLTAFASGVSAQEADTAAAPKAPVSAPAKPLPPRMKALDTDGDGQLSQEERDAAQAKRFAEADANGDGEVTQDELASFFEAQAQQRREAREAKMAERMIQEMDTNGDGKLSAEEMKPKSPEERIFAKLDTNHDGQISMEEFKAGHEKMAEQRGPGREGPMGHGRMGPQMGMMGPQGGHGWGHGPQGGQGWGGDRHADRGDRWDRGDHGGRQGMPMQRMMPAPDGAQPQAAPAPAPESDQG